MDFNKDRYKTANKNVNRLSPVFGNIAVLTEKLRINKLVILTFKLSSSSCKGYLFLYKSMKIGSNGKPHQGVNSISNISHIAEVLSGEGILTSR